MDMTPMIDVVFLMIIFFVCIDFRVLEAKLPAYLPRDRGALQLRREPVQQLVVRIVCDIYGRELPRDPLAQPRVEAGNQRLVAPPFRLEGHTVHYEVGPTRVDGVEALEEMLRRMAADQTRWVPDPARPGQRKPMPVVIEPGQGSVVDDVAKVIDAAHHAGVREITFAAGPR